MENFKGTKGKWNVGIAFQGETDNIKIKTSGQLLTVEDCDGKAVALIGRISEAEQESNAELIADAGTTMNECDLLPSELLKQHNYLLEVLKGLVNDVAELLSDHNIELQQAGYYNTAVGLIKKSTK